MIYVKTLDLGGDFENIKYQLNRIVELLVNPAINN